MKTRHHVAIQMEKEKQHQKDNGPIVKTADQLWKYSGEVEKESEEYVDLLKEQIKHVQRKKKWRTRKEYFRLYWLKKKIKKNKIK
tara:strand:+ start:64 stop:318 length:255 start_codon:yes stop_codon:yes gene_type:complete